MNTAQPHARALARDATDPPEAARGVLDAARCYRALETRDARFDGRFFTGVRTTGVYCRPVCPARCPKRENVAFYETAAQAQQAGFRPCLRCRPESSPNLAAWRGTSSTVSRALAMIHEGALDGGDVGVDDLAARLGIGERQLRRLFEEHLGVSPIVVAQTRRVLFAKKLLHETRLSMTEVALASGFGSLRRFNDTFQAMVQKSPSSFRKVAPAASAEVTVTLSYAPPYPWEHTLGFFAGRAVRGVEDVRDGRYRRVIDLDDVQGLVEVAHAATKNALTVTIRCDAIRSLPMIIGRVRRMFDLDADTMLIERQLSKDPRLERILRASPGLRVPGAWDGFELAVRAIVGQQISVKQAREILSELAASLGAPLGPQLARGAGSDLARTFPRASRLATQDLSHLPMPRARSRAIGALAAAQLEEPGLFERLRYPTVEDAVRRFKEIPGIGEWTAQYIALRALHDPDAFPAGDAALQRVLSDARSRRPDEKELLGMAEHWRPWRAYAAQHLWQADGWRRRPDNERKAR